MRYEDYLVPSYTLHNPYYINHVNVVHWGSTSYNDMYALYRFEHRHNAEKASRHSSIIYRINIKWKIK